MRFGLALQEDSSLEQLPSRTTIYRVLERHGALDGTHRQRRPAPPKGWHLPALAKGQAELDSFDFIEDLKIAWGQKKLCELLGLPTGEEPSR